MAEIIAVIPNVIKDSANKTPCKIEIAIKAIPKTNPCLE